MLFHATVQEEAELRGQANTLGLQPQEFLRSQLFPGPALVQAKIHALRARRASLEDLRESKHSECEFVLQLESAFDSVPSRESMRNDVRSLNTSGVVRAVRRRAARLREEIAKLDARINDVGSQEEKLLGAGMPAFAFVVFAQAPVADGAAAGGVPGWALGLIGFVLLAFIALGAVWWWRRRKRALAREAVRREAAIRAAERSTTDAQRVEHVEDLADDEAIVPDVWEKDVVTKGPDAGSPKAPNGQVPRGRDLRRHIHAAFTDSPTHHRRIQYVLNQPDGLELLRRICEDADLETIVKEPETSRPAAGPRAQIDPRADAIGATGMGKVRLLVFKDDDYKKLPPDVLRAALSRRARGYNPTGDLGLVNVHAGAQARAAPALPVNISPTPPPVPSTIVPPKRPVGRPRKDRPDGDPGHEHNGNGNGNGNGKGHHGGL